MLDQIVNSKIQLIQNNFLTNFSLFFSTIGDKITIICLFSILSLILIIKKDQIKIKIFAITLLLGAGLVFILKEIIARARPTTSLVIETGYSFPSGHATISTIFFGMLIYLFYNEIKEKRIKIIFVSINIAFIILISFSRIYLNVHYLTDVIGGIILGMLCIYSGHLIKNKFNWLKNKTI